jgi:hypothetical protein
MVHRGAKQAPLHAGLDLQRGVGDDQLLEAGHVAAVFIHAAHRPRKGAVDGAVVNQDLQLPERARPVLGVGQPLDLVQLRPAGQGPGSPPGVGPLSQQQLTQGRDVDHRRAGRGRLA